MIKVKRVLNIINELITFFYGNECNIIWGKSSIIKFGPGIRTRRLISNISIKNLKKKLIYMQSHWPWYELIIFTFIAKFFNIPIVFNQNGIYKKSYKNTYWISNFIIIISLLNSKIIIFQSEYCKSSIKSITNKYIWNLIKKKDIHVIINPSPKASNFKKRIQPIEKHDLIISNSFSKDRDYYAKYIFKLINELKGKKKINRIHVIGPIQKRLNSEQLNQINIQKNVYLYGYLDQISLKKVLSKSTIGIHLNYGDPSPNMVCEYMSYGIPVIVNQIGGAKEIADKACLFTKNKLEFNENKMPHIKDVEISLNKLIQNYEFLSLCAFKRSKELSIDKYSAKHLEIFNNL